MELFVLSFLWSNGSIMLQLDGTGPLHQQIYRTFRNEILSGVLAPGERVPSIRALADLLKVSRNTAVSAYEQRFWCNFSIEGRLSLFHLLLTQQALLPIPAGSWPLDW